MTSLTVMQKTYDASRRCNTYSTANPFSTTHRLAPYRVDAAADEFVLKTDNAGQRYLRRRQCRHRGQHVRWTRSPQNCTKGATVTRASARSAVGDQEKVDGGSFYGSSASQLEG